MSSSQSLMCTKISTWRSLYLSSWSGLATMWQVFDRLLGLHNVRMSRSISFFSEQTKNKKFILEFFRRLRLCRYGFGRWQMRPIHRKMPMQVWILWGQVPNLSRWLWNSSRWVSKSVDEIWGTIGLWKDFVWLRCLLHQSRLHLWNQLPGFHILPRSGLWQWWQHLQIRVSAQAILMQNPERDRGSKIWAMHRWVGH